MLINLRNALIGGKRLPYDAEVEYIRGTGSQYINSGQTVSNTLRIKSRMSIEGVCWLFGGRTGGNNKQFSVYQQASTNIRFGYANTSTNKTDSYGVHDIDFNQNVVYFDGALLHTFAASTFASASPLYIGTLSVNEQGNTSTQCLIGNIYAFQIYVDGVLVRDYIPVRKGTVGYLYDRVTGKLFGNAGTGDFVVGPDVVPVEYIESHGTEWIDTGVIASTDVSPIKIHFSPTAPEQWLVGGGDSSSAGLGLRARGYDSSKISAGYGWTNTLTYWNRGLLPINIIGLISTRFYFNDYSANTLNFSGTYNVNFALFGQNIAGSVVPAKARIYRAEIGVCSFLPVRVGTGSTWEGAMMDVLTRRIYRNAGTGAFTYGNDLKYPIPAE